MIEVVEAVESQTRIPPKSKVTFFGKFDLWRYHAVMDDRTCEICKRLDAISRFFGNHLRAQFPYLEIENDDRIKAHAHMPRDDNCRCYLTRVTEWTKDDIAYMLAIWPY